LVCTWAGISPTLVTIGQHSAKTWLKSVKTWSNISHHQIPQLKPNHWTNSWLPSASVFYQLSLDRSYFVLGCRWSSPPLVKNSEASAFQNSERQISQVYLKLFNETR
jgi:hypothetical protein